MLRDADGKRARRRGINLGDPFFHPRKAAELGAGRWHQAAASFISFALIGTNRLHWQPRQMWMPGAEAPPAVA